MFEILLTALGIVPLVWWVFFLLLAIYIVWQNMAAFRRQND